MCQRSCMVFVMVLGLALLLVAARAAVSAEDAKEAVPVEKLAPEVVEVVNKLCPGGTITTATKEADRDDQGQIEEFEYTIRVTLNNGKVHTVELDTTPDGKVKRDECEAEGPVGTDELPTAVADALKKLCPEGKLVSGKRKARFDDDQVEVEYELKLELPGGKAAEASVELAPDGSVEETSLEAPLALDEVPKGVVEALKLICPGCDTVSASRRTQARGDRVRVDFELRLKTADGKDCQARVRLEADGRIRRIEIED